jgi:hypothetical protein
LRNADNAEPILLPVRAADLLFNIASSQMMETAYLLLSNTYMAIVVAASLASLRGYENVQTRALRRSRLVSKSCMSGVTAKNLSQRLVRLRSQSTPHPSTSPYTRYTNSRSDMCQQARSMARILVFLPTRYPASAR